MNSNSIPVLGIPAYNQPKLLRRLIESIDYPIETLAIIQNGPEGCLPDITPQADMGVLAKVSPARVVIVKHPNAGVSGAWNEIIKLFPAPYWMISNDDIQFSPGDLEKMHQWTGINTRGLSGDLGMVYGNHGASWFAITQSGVDRVGLFDENIYPAYLEDCDWNYRADLLNVSRGNTPDCNSIHGHAESPTDQSKGSSTIHATPELARKNSRTHGGNFVYYRAKWGGNNGEEKFKTPFNDPNWPIWAWRFEPKLRGFQQW